MKQNVIFSTIILLVTLLACNTEEKNEGPEPEINSVLKFTQTAPSSSDANAVGFTLKSAGIYDKNLYSCFEYVGGNKAHEFSVAWDGEVIEEDGNKIIQLDIYHLTNDDNGTSAVMDSLLIGLDKLNIPEALMKDPTVRFRVVNTSNTENYIMVHPNISVGDVYDGGEAYVNYHEYKLRIVDAGCNELGKWKNNWLKGETEDSIFYFLPVEIDEAVTYQPKLNDLVKVKLQYLAIEDVEGAEGCDFVIDNMVAAIGIKEIELINE